MGCQLAGDGGGGSRSCENPGGKSDRDVRVRRGFLEEVTSGTRHAERGASQAEVDEGEREEGDDVAGRGDSTCEVPGTESGRGRLGGREAQRPWEGTGDLAAFSRPEGDGKPRGVLRGRMIAWCFRSVSLRQRGCGVGGGRA